MKGWRYDSYRHSLASKGIRTSFVANSRKGWKSKVEDLVWSDKHGRYVDWRKVAAAEGLKTGNKRENTKGDTADIPLGVNIYEGKPEESLAPDFTQFNSIPRQVTLPVTPPIAQEFREPPVPMSQLPESMPNVHASSYQISSSVEQQAQPVEDGLLEREVQSPPFIPGASLGESAILSNKKVKVTAAETLPSIMEVDDPNSLKLAMAAKRRY
jgi:hypothetical protein